nr:MAG TPA_asm: holin [Bacteriophage sp.]
MRLIDKIAKIITIVAVTMLVLSMFCRCNAKERLVEKQTYITDNRNDAKWDSLFNARLVKELESYRTSHKESVKSTTKEKTHIKDSTASKYDVNGNKVGEDRFHYEYHEISQEDVQILRDSISSLKEYKDSAAIYHSKCDSLISVINKISKDKVYVEKQLSKTDRAFLNIGKIASVCLFIGILALLGWIYRKVKLHKHS